MSIGDWISFWAFLISVGTAAGSLWAYKKYGRKLDEQQMQINEYILSQQENENLKSRCAKLIFVIIANRLIVKNDGQAEARDIELTFPSDALIRPTAFPVKIESIAPGTTSQVEIWRATTNLKAIEVYFSWVDGRGVRQSDKQHVSLD